MPQLGVMREILEREEGSMRVEADFFSVARTMPLVAGEGGLVLLMMLGGGGCGGTFYAQGGHSLVDGVQGILYVTSIRLFVGSDRCLCGPICPSLPLRAVSKFTP